LSRITPTNTIRYDTKPYIFIFNLRKNDLFLLNGRFIIGFSKVGIFKKIPAPKSSGQVGGKNEEIIVIILYV